MQNFVENERIRKEKVICTISRKNLKISKRAWEMLPLLS